MPSGAILEHVGAFYEFLQHEYTLSSGIFHICMSVKNYKQDESNLMIFGFAQDFQKIHCGTVWNLRKHLAS